MDEKLDCEKSKLIKSNEILEAMAFDGEVRDLNNENDIEMNNVTSNNGISDAADDGNLSGEPRSPEQNVTNNDSNNPVNIDEYLDELDLKYGAGHVIQLFIPVSLCMAAVVCGINFIEFYNVKDVYLMYTPFEQSVTPETSTGTRIWQSLANALIMLSVVIVMTVVLLLLYKYRCYKFIAGWLFMSSFMLLFFFTFIFYSELCRTMNIPMDYITTAVFLWNFGVLGIMCIHWKGPLLLQQFFLIVVSALMALTFIKHLPDWTTWVLLAVISIWDLVAVLAPKGPLRSLVKLAQERNDPIFPALIYSTTMAWLVEPSSGAYEADNDGGADAEADVDGEGDNVIEIHDDQVPEGQIPEGHVPEGHVHEGHVPESHVPESHVPEGHVPEGHVPEGHILSSDKAGTSANVDYVNLEHFTTEITIAAEKKSDEPDQQERPAEEQGEPQAKQKRSKHRQHSKQQNRPKGPSQQQNEQQQIGRLGHPESFEQFKQQVARLDKMEDSGVKLGLGDFIFYSVLVGKASLLGDWNTTVACFIAILMGLCFTLLLLASFRKALPALPVSIAFGLIFYFATSQVVLPFMVMCSLNQVFI
ncbi:hypothetical protein HELRODRAFT_114139 [Helobdella robusta]|uniref:Presenilin n=1 Tax=Helobdella robusta TaxID=6412 RepID=T1EFZ6_HELRO|nr:hypothetical protein HELRODRAFT_114139 [Helobdella robusta]ESN97807.1 hypothetical protein HELRODRAFT_114139 [Helobdella robusta]